MVRYIDPDQDDDDILSSNGNVNGQIKPMFSCMCVWTKTPNIMERDLFCFVKKEKKFDQSTSFFLLYRTMGFYSGSFFSGHFVCH